ncbi:hypothetical protein WA158_007594 [Blastocystis sp. Blastoise]
MSVVGIDFGSDACVIGHVTGVNDDNKKLGVDILLNDTSKRRTSSLVSFQGLERFVGEHAEPLVQTNGKNTVSALKKILGRKFSDPIIQEEMKLVPFKIVQLENDEVGIEIEYGGKNEIFSPEQIMAIILKHCCDLVKKDEKTNNDPSVVISVPAFWNERQRQSLLDSCTIGGIRCEGLINENSATAIEYGLFRNLKGEFDKEKPRYVMFVDMGYSMSTVSVVCFLAGVVKILSCCCDPTLGSVTLDRIIASFIAEDFMKKHKSDPRGHVRSNARLMAAATKAKLFLSPQGVDRAVINVECLHNDYDYSNTLYLNEFQRRTREAGVIDRLKRLVNTALTESGLTTVDIHSVEIVGGGMRVPQLKEAVASVMKRNMKELNYGLSTTLNMDECICKGVTWACALGNENMKLKAYNVLDRLYYDYSINDVPIFVRGDSYPTVKSVAIPVNKQGEYTLKSSENKNAIYTITIIDDCSKYASKSLLMEIYVDSSSCITIQKIYVEDSKGSFKQDNKSYKSLCFSIKGKKYDTIDIHKFMEKEKEMTKEDEEIKERNKIKNEMESYIYKMRDIIENLESIYVKREEKEEISHIFMDNEDWLYSEECMLATKEQVIKRYQSMKEKGDHIINRQEEGKNRNKKIIEMNNMCSSLKRQIKTIQEEYMDVKESEVNDAYNVINDANEWLKDAVTKQSSLPLTETPILLCSDIDAKINEVQTKTKMFITKKRDPKGSPILSSKGDKTTKGNAVDSTSSTQNQHSDSDSDNCTDTSDLSDL